MGEITLLPHSPKRPELILAAIEKRWPFDEIEQLSLTRHVVPNDLATDDELRRHLAIYRETLEKLPAESILERMSTAVTTALARRSEPVVNRLIVEMIGGFPNLSANAANPRGYVDSLLADVADLGFPDAIVGSACLEARRTLRFVPTISEFLGIANRHSKRANALLRIITRIQDIRSNYADAIETVEVWLEPAWDSDVVPF